MNWKIICPSAVLIAKVSILVSKLPEISVKPCKWIPLVTEPEEKDWLTWNEPVTNNEPEVLIW